MILAKDFARAFYSSKRWQDCRNQYARQKRHLCERCLLRGRVVPGEIVHHKTELTPQNINMPTVSLSFDNLELLCRECHAEVHDKRMKGRRYVVTDSGEVVVTSGKL